MEGALNWPRRSCRLGKHPRKCLVLVFGGGGLRGLSCQRSPPEQQPLVRVQLGAHRAAPPPQFYPLPIAFPVLSITPG